MSSSHVHGNRTAYAVARSFYRRGFSAFVVTVDLVLLEFVCHAQA